MSKESVFQVIKESIVDILPEISTNQIEIALSLQDLGANSIDRMDIIIRSMESLGVKIPLVELARVSNIQGLVDLFYERARA
ncbi:Acyl carrier protein [Candidatus Desulfosporosinus infrequens]|uniref:Acyl carrier protein n=1 Tax=Candidatus Desulfosporosinus infrequens TaxID=2043169 RepID=A0A2U3KMC1_9FIRM|nr:Acyl carrier protein [Candidatus Desulfosporosinus infrequens]